MPTATASKHQALAQRVQEDPGFFCSDILGCHLWSKQTEILESVRDNRKTAVRSCHGTGKTFTAGDAALWFLYGFPNSRVITTAPTWSQVRDQLWHEINLRHSALRVGTRGICLRTRLELPDGRYAVGLSTKPGQEESFQGHHAENLLLIFDEASGIPGAIYEAGEGYMTTEGARQLLVGNPTRTDGEFFSAFHSKREEYAQIHISAYDTPNFTGEEVPDDVGRRLISKLWVEERESWRGSSLWDVRVMGDFPKQPEDSVVSLAVVEAAQQREIDPHPDDGEVVTCDVARFGSDETVVVHRKGYRVRILEHHQGQDLMQTVGHLKNASDAHGRCRIVVDDVGVGGGVTDRLREQGYEVEAFNGGETAIREDEYPNRRSELWFTAAEQLPQVDLDPDEALAADLLAPTYKLDSRGRRVVEPKDRTKSRLKGRSPDRGDAVLLSFSPRRGPSMEVW